MDKAPRKSVLARIDAISAGPEEALIVVGEVGAGKYDLLQSALGSSAVRAEIAQIHPAIAACVARRFRRHPG